MFFIIQQKDTNLIRNEISTYQKSKCTKTFFTTKNHKLLFVTDLKPTTCTFETKSKFF